MKIGYIFCCFLAQEILFMLKNKLDKQTESTIIVAILSYFFKEKLLTPDEYARIKSTLRLGDIIVDNDTNKSDVYV